VVARLYTVFVGLLLLAVLVLVVMWMRDPYGLRYPSSSEPLRGWARVVGFLVVVALIVGFAWAMASGDYSGLGAAQ
jgi:hypothetical protein